MVQDKSNPMTSTAWEQLKEQASRIRNMSLAEAFQADPTRLSKFSFELSGLYIDFSKNLVDDQVFQYLLELVRELGLEREIKAMFQGQKINKTENRAVLHTALRAFEPTVKNEVKELRANMHEWVSALHNGKIKGYNGNLIKNIVNIGIGGSDLGPAMVCEALVHHSVGKIEVHFVSNVDPNHLEHTLRHLDPETTLFFVASKSFGTQETLANANSAKAWLLQELGDEGAVQDHFYGITANIDAAEEFGIRADRCFPMWDWVGGRFSLWSSIGLPIACQIGFEAFQQLLQGAESVDLHFQAAPFDQNIPVVQALISFWYTTFMGAQSEAIIPYDQRLKLLPPYLQQAVMESNGKNVDRDGQPIPYATSPIVWGAPGTNGQHAFFQLLHQGKHLVPCDFIACKNGDTSNIRQHQMLLANYIAQPEALMVGKPMDAVVRELKMAGKSDDEIKALAPYKVFTGNRPSTSILIDRLTPYHLGQLIALYEHKIFTLGVLWNIFSFDQWGVELGKKLAHTTLDEIQKQKLKANHDPSTQALLNKIIGNQ